MAYTTDAIITQIKTKEDRVSNEGRHSIDEASEMITYLESLLASIKDTVLRAGFSSQDEEVHFFRVVKPLLLGKLVYYNKVYRIETVCPVQGGKMYQKYFLRLLEELKQEYKEQICGSYFYRYYRSGRTDRDTEYFTRGHINYRDGLSSYVFEIDRHFSTYYDSLVARLLANEYIYAYLMGKIAPEEGAGQLMPSQDASKDIFWTDSKNALIELIYALHASGVVSHGKIGIRKITMVFQVLFSIPLGDVHHAFHRMKDRANNRTAFLDHLKASLEHYMDKGL